MSTVDVVLKKVDLVRLVELSALAASYTPEDIGPVIRPLCGELVRRMTANSIPFIGPCTAYYEPADDDKVTVHAGMPFNGDTADGLTVVDLPTIDEAATLVHHGVMAEISGSYQALAHWIEDNGYRAREGEAREVYLHCPENEQEWVTELQIPVTKAG